MFFYFIKRKTAPEAVVKMLTSIPISPDLVLLQPACKRPSPPHHHHPSLALTQGPLNSSPLTLSAFLVARLLSYVSPTNLRRTVYQGPNSLGFRVGNSQESKQPTSKDKTRNLHQKTFQTLNYRCLDLDTDIDKNTSINSQDTRPPSDTSARL